MLIATYHAIAHERGHRVLHAMEKQESGSFLQHTRQFADFAASLSDESLQILLAERFCQSIADQLLARELERQGFKVEQSSAIRSVLSLESPTLIQAYRHIAALAEERGQSLEQVSQLVLDVQKKFTVKGHDAEAHLLTRSVNWSAIGYHMQRFSLEQLHNILKT